MSDGMLKDADGDDLVLPGFDDLVYIGEEAGGIYRYEPMRFRVTDAAPLPDGYLAMTGYRMPEADERDEQGLPIEPLRAMTVLVRRAGVTVLHRSTLLTD